MQMFGLVGHPNVTVVTYTDAEDEDAMDDAAWRDNGTYHMASAKKVEIARAQRRLASQGAREVRFFPVNH